MKRLTAIVAALVTLAGVSAACSSSGSGSGATFTVGSADFTESAVLAYIYADAISAKGVKTNVHANIGERATYLTALKQGSIDMVPEYDGSLLYFTDPKATAKAQTDVDQALPAAIGSKLAVYKSSSATDSDSLTVTQATATKYHLSKISDLASVASKLTMGAPAAFKTRPDGIPALKTVYGITFGTFTPLSAGGTSTLDALKNGDVDVADIFTTDPSIPANHLVVLQDDKHMFASQNVIPLVLKSKTNSKVEAACNAVSAKLTTSILTQLDSKAAGGQKPQDVASAWVKSAGLG
jgi:osmoprotectant transport system substrate-binding protein